jgi:MSHA pilin protein MshA
MKQTVGHHSILNNQKGFTLIELIVVIVILGILAVVAVPKYADMQAEANVAAAEGVYGAAQGATSINFAANLVGKNITKITDGATLLGAMDGTPDGWSSSSKTIVGQPFVNTGGTTVTPTITVTTDETATNKATLTLTYL